MSDVPNILNGQDPELVRAAQDLARAVGNMSPNPAYAPRLPSAFLVGGFVRDALLGLKSKDADVEVYGVAPNELVALLERMFGKVMEVGRAFGVMKVSMDNGHELDVSIPRRESKIGLGHTGFLIDSDPSLDVREAARRRDFTVNAMAMDPLTGDILDPFNGLADIRTRTLRVTDPATFVEDPLRVLRAMQFLARLEFVVDPESERFMREMVGRGELAELSAERVTAEFEKLLTKAERPSVGLAFARSVGIVERLFPELHALIGVPQEPEWHPEGDVWTHTLMVADEAAKIIRQDDRGFSETEKRQVALGALCHDFGKPFVTRPMNGRIRSIGHSEAGESPARAFFSRLTFGERDVDAALAVVATHLRPGMLFRAKEKGELDERSYANAVRKMLRELGPVSWRVVLASAEADARGRSLPGAATNPYGPGLLFSETVARLGLDQEAQRTLLQGRDLIELFRLKPGPRFREIIAAVEAARDRGEIETREQAVELVKNLLPYAK